MANLIPQKEQKIIRDHYLERLLSITLFYILVSLVFACIFMVPAYILTVSKEKSAESRLEVLKQSVSYRVGTDIEKKLQETKDDLNAISLYIERKTVLEILDFVIESKNSNISLNNIGYQRVNESLAEINLSGKAESRDSLLSYVDVLSSNEFFENVDLPISNLTRDRDIEFSLRFQASLKQENEKN